MKPIYFPFTYIPESVAGSLSRFFGPAIVFQPVSKNPPEAIRRLAENGRIEIRVPCSGDEDRLIGFTKEFKEWGRLHHGEESSLKDIFKNGFYSKTFVSQIRTDILKNQKEETFEPDPVFLSRLFLLMAQELDIQQSEIDGQLALSVDDELELFTSMTGEKKSLDPTEESLPKEDRGAYMTAARLAAWFRLMENTDEGSAFLVTNSPAAFDALGERVTGLEKVFAFEGLSRQPADATVENISKWLTHLATTPWSCMDHVEVPDFTSGDLQKINFKLYILPGVGPDVVCSLFLKAGDAIISNKNKYLNTLIGVFET